MIYTILVILLAITSFGCFNLTKRVEKYEEQISELETGVGYYQNVVDSVRKQMLDVQARLVEIDIRGSFEADDEVGFVFKEIKSNVEQLNETIKIIYE